MATNYLANILFTETKAFHVEWGVGNFYAKSLINVLQSSFIMRRCLLTSAFFFPHF